MDFLSCHHVHIDFCNSKLMLWSSSGEQSRMEVPKQTVPHGKVIENCDIELVVSIQQDHKS